MEWRRRDRVSELNFIVRESTGGQLEAQQESAPPTSPPNPKAQTRVRITISSHEFRKTVVINHMQWARFRHSRCCLCSARRRMRK